jgi:hypothetical protein
MAKRETKVLPARKSAASRDDDSLLTRSAESLGRVIGSLQRQMQGTTKRMSNVAEDARDALPELPQWGRRAAGGSRKSSGTRKSAARKRGGARKDAGTRKSGATAKRAGARKSASARKTSGARKSSRRKTSTRSR